MPSSREFSGSLIPFPDELPYYIVLTGGLQCRFKNVVPNSGGIVAVNVVAISNPANTMSGVNVTPATVTTQGITATTVVNSAGTNADFQNSTTLQIEVVPGAGSIVVPGFSDPNQIDIACGDTVTVTDFVTGCSPSPFPNAYSLATFTGSGASFVVDAGPLPFSGATNAAWDTTTGVWTPTTVNGTQFIGQLGNFTSTGTLPSNVTTSSNAYSYPIKGTNPPQYQFFTTTNAIQRALINFQGEQAPTNATGLLIPADTGTVGATLTWTPIAPTSMTSVFQICNSAVPSVKPSQPAATANVVLVPGTLNNFSNAPNGLMYEGSATKTITTTGTYFHTFRSGVCNWNQVTFAIQGSTILVQVYTKE